MKEFQLQPFALKNNSLNVYMNWKVKGYVIAFILIALFLSSISMVSYNSELTFIAGKLLQLLIFIALGTANAVLLENRSNFAQHSMKEKLYFSFVLALLIYGLILLLYFLAGSNLQRMALTSSCAFLLPHLLFQAWQYYITIPASKSMIWYGYKPVIHTSEIVYLNTIKIQIKLSRKYMVEEDASFLINTPLNLELGKLFNSFLNFEKQANTVDIECYDDNNKPYGWQFFIVSLGGMYKRILDPEKSLLNNQNIKKNATILAKRVRTR